MLGLNTPLAASLEKPLKPLVPETPDHATQISVTRHVNGWQPASPPALGRLTATAWRRSVGSGAVLSVREPLKVEAGADDVAAVVADVLFLALLVQAADGAVRGDAEVGRRTRARRTDTLATGQVRHSSKLRRRNRSIWSVSRPVNLRASLKARMVARSLVSRAGMRHSW